MVCLGASAAALWAMTCGAEAKKVYYEIDGVRYSYSTNNRQQVREARERINAANAADAAKAKAQAERAANPLAALFGSPAQTAAKEAESRARQAVAGGQSGAAAPAETAAPESRREARRSRRETRRERALARAERPAVQASVAAKSAVMPSAATTGAVTAVAKSPAPAGAPAPGVKSVFYDLSSGIKTVQMSDGTVHEEPFDAATVPSLGADPGNLTDFVNGLRKPAPEDATGTVPAPPAKGG
jgi:membrane protein involved in colicin uptake